MSDSTIHEDVHTIDDTGFDAFLSSFDDDAKKRPSESDQEAPEPQAETSAKTENEEGEPEGSEDDPDNQEVEIKVGEETKKATLRDLKRLYGQEAALTQKSQKASEQLRAAEEQIARASASAKGMLERAQTRYAPYKEWGVPEWSHLASTLSADDFNALRAEANAAKADVDFLTQEVEGYMKEQQQTQVKAYQEAAQACVKELSDPEKGIKDFGPALYEEMVGFATQHGVPAAEVRQIVSAPALRILHMAMMYAKSQQAVKSVEQKVQKAVEKPTRVLKPGGAKPPKDNKQAAMQQLRRSGEVDDAVDAFMASF